ncbi:hypothetical protein PV326_007860, partial [Microctonus aethiopoides]
SGVRDSSTSPSNDPVEEVRGRRGLRQTSWEAQLVVDHADPTNRTIFVNSQLEESNNNSMVDLIASFDAGWQKRRSGFSRNSLSGCRRGKSAEEHSCQKNWSGSSKSMEPAMETELIAQNHLMEKLSARVTILIADDDAATISNVQKNVSWKIKKWSDINHVKKNSTTQLYALKTPVAIMKYFTRRLMLIIQSNKNNPEGIKELLLSAVDHAYGNHECCGLWCGYIQNPDSYQYANLPGKKPFTDVSRKQPFKDVFKKLADNVVKIVPCGSTQRNESFNHTVAVSHPKNLFYVSTQSFVSPQGKAKDEIAEVRAKRLKDPEVRKCINKRKLLRSKTDFISENREGISYESGCSWLDFSSLGIALKDTEKEYVVTGEEMIVVFDLETISLTNETEICQIAAAVDESDMFNVYIMPQFGISKRASLITGLTAYEEHLYFQGEVVEAVSAKEALTSFLEYLKVASKNRNVILSAHNCYRFDAIILLNNLCKHQLLDDFQKTVKMFSDTLVVFRKCLPNRRKEKKSYSLTALTEEFIGEDALKTAHNAMTDVYNLLAIVNILKVHNLITEHAKSVCSILTEKAKVAATKELKNTLELLRMSETMKNRVAAEGISLKELIDFYTRDGGNSIRFLFSENINGKPRISKNKAIIEKLIENFKNLSIIPHQLVRNNVNNNEDYECCLDSDDDYESDNNCNSAVNDDDEDNCHDKN